MPPGGISGALSWIALRHKERVQHRSGTGCRHLEKSLSHSARPERKPLPGEDLLCNGRQLCVDIVLLILRSSRDWKTEATNYRNQDVNISGGNKKEESYARGRGRW